MGAGDLAEAQPPPKKPRTDGTEGDHAEALTRAKQEAGLGSSEDCSRTFLVQIGKWQAVRSDSGGDYFGTTATPCKLELGGAGLEFGLRLARHSAATLEAAEEAGDFDITPLELQLVAETSSAEALLAAMPPHFKLFAYQCVGTRRPPSGNFEEILDTANLRFLRKASAEDSNKIALAFTLPGSGAMCEQVGVSHELLHQCIDDLQKSDGTLDLALVVPLPQRVMTGQFTASSSTIQLEVPADDGSGSSSSGSSSGED
eukprot:TRINITY_DN17823_c0_g1_i1.p1 TRINITY_DN17823_c0_g1~~TRINITY_DN17823_c0_g1_i1.p1  ORF type:complete len:258 (-),score=61.97 TRINITY_DN17823_c0_g1_i1:30-803(-)